MVGPSRTPLSRLGGRNRCTCYLLSRVNPSSLLETPLLHTCIGLAKKRLKNRIQNSKQKTMTDSVM